MHTLAKANGPTVFGPWGDGAMPCSPQRQQLMEILHQLESLNYTIKNGIKLDKLPYLPSSTTGAGFCPTFVHLDPFFAPQKWQLGSLLGPLKPPFSMPLPSCAKGLGSLAEGKMNKKWDVREFVIDDR